jgi:hypothetical protein
LRRWRCCCCWWCSFLVELSPPVVDVAMNRQHLKVKVLRRSRCRSPS